MLTKLFSPSQMGDSVGASADAAGGSAVVILGLVYVIVLTLASIIGIVAMFRLYRKIGVSPLVIFVPIYNVYVFFKAFGVRRWFWGIALCYGALFASAYYMSTSLIASEMTAFALMYALSCILTFVVLAGSLHYTYNMARSFGKGFSFFVGLLLFPPIFYLILAFGKADYVGAPD